MTLSGISMLAQVTLSVGDMIAVAAFLLQILVVVIGAVWVVGELRTANAVTQTQLGVMSRDTAEVKDTVNDKVLPQIEDVKVTINNHTTQLAVIQRELDIDQGDAA